MAIESGQAPPTPGRKDVKEFYVEVDSKGEPYLVVVYPGYYSIFKATDTSKYGGPGTIKLPS